MDLAYALWPNARSGGQHGVCSPASPRSGGSKEGRCGSIRCVSTSFHVCYAWREAPVLVIVIIPWTLVVLRGMDDKMHVDPIQDLRASFASTVGCLSSLAFVYPSSAIVHSPTPSSQSCITGLVWLPSFPSTGCFKLHSNSMKRTVIRRRSAARSSCWHVLGMNNRSSSGRNTRWNLSHGAANMQTREGKAVITKSKKIFIYALVRMTFLL